MQRHGLLRPVQSNYTFTVFIESKSRELKLATEHPETKKKPIITLVLAKPNALLEMDSLTGFTFTVGKGFQISFAIDLNSENFYNADLAFRAAVGKSQRELSLNTRDVDEIITKYEVELRKYDLLKGSHADRKVYTQLGHFRPEGNAF